VTRGDGPGELYRGLIASWCALWLVVGVWTGYELWQLSDLGPTVAESGRALDSAGTALESLGSVPVVGDQTAELGSEVRANAQQIVADAIEARASIRRRAGQRGLAIALVPSVPVLAAYAAVRRRRLLEAGV
jgi:hypothetical protein